MSIPMMCKTSMIAQNAEILSITAPFRLVPLKSALKLRASELMGIIVNHVFIF